MHQWVLVWENISTYCVCICVKMFRQQDWQISSLDERRWILHRGSGLCREQS
uniref:Uncharacterized protein n=1 Tax=Seriola lalandi dorsalis TaxID=1841481 RepID=A0A3B4Y655_SERLL